MILSAMADVLDAAVPGVVHFQHFPIIAGPPTVA
jgi:hypothetical protein